MQVSGWSFPKVALALALGGSLLGAACSFLITPMYVSTATLQITPLATDGSPAETGRAQFNELVLEITSDVLSRSFLNGVLLDQGLQRYRGATSGSPTADVIEEARRSISIRIVPPPANPGQPAYSVNVSFQYPDAAKAQRTNAAIVNKFREAFDGMQLTWPHSGEHHVEVIDVPRLPGRPVYPTQPMVMLAGLVAGLLTALAWNVLRGKPLASRRFLVSAFALGIACAVLTSAVYRFDTEGQSRLGEQFRSIALVSIENGTAEQVQTVREDVLSPKSLSYVINDPRLQLSARQLRSTASEDLVLAMRRNLRITPVGGHYISVSFDYADRYKTLMAVQTLMARIDEATHRLLGGSLGVGVGPFPWSKLAIVEEPSMPVFPATPSRYIIAASGGIAGLLAAVVIAVVRGRHLRMVSPQAPSAG